MSDDFHFMDRVIEGRTVRESIAAAEAAGKLIPVGEIRWSLPKPGPDAIAWIFESKGPNLNCRFYRSAVFEHVYQKKRVPAGCATCYKVKVVPKTLRQLKAACDVGHALPYTYKSGTDFPSAYSSGIYGTYFYLRGLEAARSAYKRIREIIDTHPQLGSDVTVFIKRGCTEYEMHCGPSDRYTFSDETKEIESDLLSHLQVGREISSTPPKIKESFTSWIKLAYQLGDETYKDFAGGKRLLPAVVRYAPDEAIASGE